MRLLVAILFGVMSLAAKPAFRCHELMADRTAQDLYLDTILRQGYLARILAPSLSAVPTLMTFIVEPLPGHSATVKLIKAIGGLDRSDEAEERIAHYMDVLKENGIPFRQPSFFDPLRVRKFMEDASGKYNLSGQFLVATMTLNDETAWDLKSAVEESFFRGWSQAKVNSVLDQLKKLTRILGEKELGGFPVSFSLNRNGVLFVADLENVLVQNAMLKNKAEIDLPAIRSRIDQAWMKANVRH